MFSKMHFGFLRLLLRARPRTVSHGARTRSHSPTRLVRAGLDWVGLDSSREGEMGDATSLKIAQTGIVRLEEVRTTMMGYYRVLTAGTTG